MFISHAIFHSIALLTQNQAQHKHYNGILNKRASQLNQNLRRKIDCVHNKEIDSFHSSGRGSGKVRVTRDQGKTDIKEMIEKVRVADLAIYSPKRLFDWRLSINMEVPRMFNLINPLRKP